MEKLQNTRRFKKWEKRVKTPKEEMGIMRKFSSSYTGQYTKARQRLLVLNN